MYEPCESYDARELDDDGVEAASKADAGDTAGAMGDRGTGEAGAASCCVAAVGESAWVPIIALCRRECMPHTNTAPAAHESTFRLSDFEIPWLPS